MSARLREVPWAALEGLASTLEPALARILSGAAADTELDRLLRANRHFSAHQRRVTAEALFGVGLWRRRLRAHAGPTASPLQLLACLARDLGGDATAPQRLGVDLPPSQPLTDWRDRTSLPDWLAEALEAAVGTADAPTLADALNTPGPITVRANTARTTRDALATRLAAEDRPTTPGRWSPDALHLTIRPANLTATQPWREGLFELQDEGSQLLAALVPEGDTLLDLCAGAGGKTLALAARLPTATLHATDVDHARVERLRLRASRAGASVRLHHALPPDLRVDHVLIDAPCSELGALRRGPDLRWRLDPATFSQWPPIQRALLEQARAHLEPGGTLTYATCTLRPEENEHVVAAFLERHPDFTRERPALPDELLDADGALRLFPHRHGTDGFFAVRLRQRR
ncbi:MAG: RsmB/NOP family class I SAM-dependent RNA methyltransferase [Myxococcus sp.]|nr:RsmB/NOP family class I SAM-dependent RNA methyltransferase [Myxococcus sp.]